MNILKSFGRVLAAGAIVASLSALPAIAEEAGEVFRDGSRIASVGGPVTEIVYALGEERKLVARDSTSLYPDAALALPDVGYMRALSPEGVLSINPTGILVVDGSGPKEALDVLKKASVQYIAVPDTYDHQGILTKIRVVGRAIGVDAKAEALASEVDSKLRRAEALTADIKERKRVLFVLSMQGGKIMAAGTGTSADGIIRMAGAVNALEGVAGYKQVSDESVIDARPDVVLMMDRGGDHSVADGELFTHPALATTPAGASQALIRMNGGLLLGFGPRTADAIHDLAVSLYGDRVSQ